jgi:drug/metabolite transporter (DMT)-like permease
MSSKSLPISVWIVFCVLCIVWGTTYFGISIGVKYMPPFFFSAMRHILAGSIFTIFFLLRGHKLPHWRDILKLGMAGILMITGGNALLSWAELYISSGLAGILSALAPLYITFLSFIFFKGFRATAPIFIGLILCIGGIYFLTQTDSSQNTKNGFELGVILTILANLFWALGAIFIKKYPVDVNIYLRTGLQMLIGGFVNIIMSLFTEPIPNMAHLPFEFWGVMAYLVIVGSLIGYSCFVYVLEFMEPARVSIHTYVNTVVAVVIGWLFAKEQLTSVMVLAMAVVMVGVIIVNREYGKMAAKKQALTAD